MANDPDPLVTQVLALTKPGEDEHGKRVKRYNDAYQIYRPGAMPASRTAKAGSDTGTWRSKVKVPYGMQVVDTALVNIVGGKPTAKVLPRTPQSEESSRAMQLVLDYYLDMDHFVEKTPVFVQQALIFGVTVAKNHWLYRETTKQIEGHNYTLVERDGPTFEPWDVYDAWWDPEARDADTARYVVLRSWLSAEQLKELAKNEENPEGLYENVSELLAMGPAEGSRALTAQERLLGGKTPSAKGRYEILEIWTDDTLYVCGNRNVLLRYQANPYWHGRKPVVITQTRPDVFRMQGIPEVELLDDLQQALWTLQNARIDNLHLSVMRGITFRDSIPDPTALELRPGFKWPVQDHDDIRPFEYPPVSSDVYHEDEILLGRMQLVTGINPFVSGADMQSVDQNTATGITALQEVASRLLRFKAAQIEYKGYQRTYEQWIAMIKQFLDKPLAVRIEGPGNTRTWKEFGPQEVIGEFDVKVEGTEESLSRQQKRGEAIALLNAFAPLVPTGAVNIKPVLEQVAEAYGFPNPEALFPVPQGPAMPVPNGMPQQQLPQAQQQPQLLGGQQMDPRIAQAIMGGGQTG